MVAAHLAAEGCCNIMAATTLCFHAIALMLPVTG
jgi:hypothetical protein